MEERRDIQEGQGTLKEGITISPDVVFRDLDGVAGRCRRASQPSPLSSYVAILVAIGMFRASGAMDMLTNALRPMLQATRFPPEIFPLVILRTLSGSGSLALTTDIVKQFGPDSLIGRTAATIYGGSETTFYVLAVYFGAIGVKRTRHAIPAALVGDMVAAIVAVAVCTWMFS